MGSRRGRHAALVAGLGALALSSCASGPPPGFSGGEQWAIPLIGPIEEGLLLVPALVNDKGPFVFAIDPDAHVSIIDEEVLAATKPATGEGPRILDENDTEQNKFYAEILSWQVGTLTVQGPKPAQIVGKGTFDVDGRRVHGVIGRDIIADSLVFSFDRDAGVAVLGTQKSFKPVAGASVFAYSKLQSRIPNAETLPLPRRLIATTVNGVRFPLHLDLGAAASQLRPRAWARAKLVEADAQLAVVDEAGTLRQVKKKGVASSVSVGEITSKDVVFIPYVDRRWPDQDIEGTVGLGFFKPYSVTVNWDQDKVYVVPRRNTASNTVARIGRWQSKTLSSCQNVGCIKTSLIDPLAGKPADQMPAQHPGLVASFARDPSALKLDLEVLVAVSPAEGKPMLRWFVVNLPAGTDRALTHVSADYLGATLTVIDASPFPRACPAAGGCVDMLAAPARIDPNATQLVASSLLKRKTGGDSIPPDEGDKTNLVGAGRYGDGLAVGDMPSGKVTTTAKVCAKADGGIDKVTIVKSSGLPSYDEKIERTIREEWTYEPYVLNGKPIPFCTAVTFVYQYSKR